MATRPRTRATRPRDLRTGTPLWLAPPRPRVGTRALARTLEADVVVVGAGISGALMADALARPGRRVAILDRREPMLGSTAASTALLLFEIDRPLYSLARRIGEDNAVRAWRRSMRAVSDLRALVADMGIRCHWREMDSLLLAGDAYGSRALRMETVMRNSVDIPGAYLTAKQLDASFAITRTGGIISGGSAVADPMELTAGLLRRVRERGVTLHAPIHVTEVTSRGGEVHLQTAGQHNVAAEHVVFCTGYELVHGVPTKGHALESTWAFATTPKTTYPAWLDHTVVWEASDPYLYLRTAPGGRLVVGGEDEPYAERHTRPALFAQKIARIERKLRALLPALQFRVGHRWAGTFGDSASGLPRIGKVPDLPHCHYVMGFGGNGITNSVIAAQIVAKAIAGKVDPDADLYDGRES